MKKLIYLSLFSLICFTFHTLHAQEKKAYLVSNAHFDTQWKWDVQTSIKEYIPKTMDQNIFLLKKYPNYIFNFEGGIKYSWMKEYYPYQYDIVKQYIKEGRWIVNGSTWDANDVNIPSPESFTRNILYGQHFYEDEFGVRGTDIFLPDCFGFSWIVPTIAAHSGLIGFSTQKLIWRQQPLFGDKKIPFEIGLWEGVDGARIMIVADGHDYNTVFNDEDLSKSEKLNKIIEDSPLKTVYQYYGVGDTGGSPTMESIAAVDKSVNGEGDIRIISAASDQLYKDYLPFASHPELPVYKGELLIDVHASGCYTSQAAMKQYNRRNEQLADAAERAAVTADWLGGISYPKRILTEAWKRFLWHQFHDDLTGTSIPRAYEFSWNDELLSLKQFSNVLTSSVGSVSRTLDTQVKGLPLVIYNPLSFPVSDIIKVDVELPGKSDKISVYNEKGEPVASQELSRQHGKVTLLVAATVPSVGYVVYDIRSTAGKKQSTPLKAEGKILENSIYKVTLDDNGDIQSVYDKRHGREMIQAGKSVRLALFPENESIRWPAWEIHKKEMDKESVSVTGDVKITVVENGPVRAAVSVERKYGASSFKQVISLTEGGQDERIDIYNEIDWQTTNALLKAEFPFRIANPEATYDLGIGAIKRGNNTDAAYEVYAQYWADITDLRQNYGVSVMNNSKYGWDKPDDHTLRLTLFHTPKTRGRYAFQDKQDFGKHAFTYSITGHEGDYVKSGTVRKAEVLNQPPQAFIAAKHKGTSGKALSFLQVDNSQVIVKALKKSERSDDYIIRLYETSGIDKQSVSVSFADDILAAKELNGVEDETRSAHFSGRKLNFEIPPFGIKTFKVKLKNTGAKLALTEYATLELPYNMKASSYNAFRVQANFDGRGNSYASELFPSELDFNGIPFKFGNCDTFNGLKCKGDTIQLPQGQYNSLYILAASAKKDSKVDFLVDGKPQSAIIPNYTGFIGQWGHTGHTEGFLKSADVAFAGTHAHNYVHNRDLPYEFTYMFAVKLDIPRNARQLILPDQPKIVLFAATLANDLNNTLTPATDILRVNLTDRDINDEMYREKNLLYGKKVIEKSGEANAKEPAEAAIDEDMSTKWCDNSTTYPKYITIDLGKEEKINGWYVFHAGLEAPNYITSDYALQVKSTPEEEWRTIDSVTDNTKLETDRRLKNPESARYIKLLVTKPDQGTGKPARIYEFSVY